MANFYHNLITEKSFELLKEIKQEFKFVLIGGWAVFLYTKALKSKDIDIVVDYEQLARLKEKFELFKNERLKKYEAKKQEIDIDIYLPHYSDLGIPVEEIIKNSQNIEGFLVPPPEVLLILKLFSHKSRAASTKGKKDLIDIFALLKQELIDWKQFKNILKKHKLENLAKVFKDIVASQKAIPELGLSNHKIAQLKKKVLKEL